MEFGHLNVMQNWHKDLDDFQTWQGEIEVALECERVGFDALSCVEHHFEDYGMCGDNFMFLAYLAARTERAKLMTGACILPWNDPLRVVEKMAMLENLAPGRCNLGLGRGLSKKEYRGFRQDMNESRDRFDEAAEMVLRGLDTGFVEGDGPYYPQPKVEVRPRPLKGYRDSLFCVAMSPDSATAAARLGARMMTFIQYPIEHHVPMIEGWRAQFREFHPGRPLPEPILTDVTVCHEDPEEAERLAYEHLGNHFIAVMQHYDFGGDHFKNIRGYEAYQVGADLIKEAGLEASQKAYVDAQNWGTPEQIIDKYRERHELIGDFSALVVLSYGGMPFEAAKNSARLMGEQVIPAVKEMWAETPMPATV
ncbi:MAG TPA: LLM class flavin-dependent oxidoreductase [Solirubrobacteraceae bacterium]|jgi:alkanesulfonate monooxygenase SsuD/methylene tetrahydromethanopterin reductase-like flavin-dependent oxidoreductase (luciferase family)|nr:LLM class flavin-dependent oxidoreductase [Solirubrobacteraceae bacterium]